MMQLNELDKKTLIELKDEIADLEARVKELSAIRVKQDVPLEVLLEQSSYKAVWDDGYREGEAQARDLIGDFVPLHEKKLTYSAILESGKRYVVEDGIISLVALKIFDGTGLFKFETTFMEKEYPFSTFTAIPEEKYVLFELGLIFTDGTGFQVKELEGHIRYVLAMSTFLNPEIKEMK